MVVSLHNKKLFLVVLLAGLVVFSGTLGLANGEISSRLAEVVQYRLGLAPDFFEVIETEYQGERLILIVIYGSERVQNSSLGNEIKDALTEHQGQNPVAISVLSRNKEAKFQPYAIRVLQNGEKLSVREVVGLTEGFADGKMPEKVPIEDKTFWGSKGVVTLGENFNAEEAFQVKYGTSTASFSGISKGLSQVSNPSVSSEGQDQDVNPNTNMGPSSNANQDGETGNQHSPPNQPSGSNSKAEHGFTLFSLGGTLLLLTLSLL